ncbi:MAG TPA: helix-turn-helix transcriptional regulator [Candidatus Limnocylindrales bacterium]|jgi:transcriptional regulator with XRE-family HTH domain
MPYERDPDAAIDAALRMIGSRLKRTRIALGLSQRALEALSGVDQTTISRIENGRAPSFSLGRYARILAALDRYRLAF